MRFEQNKLHDKLWHKFYKDKLPIKTVSGGQNLFQTLLRALLDVTHILIRGHNHTNGMAEKVIDTQTRHDSYEHNGRSLVTCFMDSQITWIRAGMGQKGVDLDKYRLSQP